MLPSPRRRSLLAVWLVVLIALGLGSRRPDMAEFCVLYVGDVLWGALFFVLAALVRPSATTVRLWIASTAVTELIELSQLYRAPWAEGLRATRVGGLLLGHAFSWSDLVCVALGAAVAAGVDARMHADGGE
jgi:hypothetical protein